jgi:phosphatidylserine/phosphatidylglycerophosphate/cardiolipin synthase-like enzyme
MDIISDNALNNMVYRVINDSSTVLTLITPYFEPSDGLRRAIVTAAKRGVFVNLIIRDIRRDEYQRMKQSTTEALEELIKYNVVVKWLERLQCENI